MRFALIDTAKAEFPIDRLCGVLGVSQSGYFAWRGRPACRRQRDDMVPPAHVRSAFTLSNGTYGSPRMMRELRDSGLTVGRRRTARLMRENGLRVSRSGGLSAPPTASIRGRWRQTCSIRTSRQPGPTRNGVPIFPMSDPRGLAVPRGYHRLVCPPGRRLGDRLLLRPHRDLALAALRKALAVRRPAAGLIHHSDRGSHTVRSIIKPN